MSDCACGSVVSGTYDIVAIGVDCVFEMRTDNEKNSEKKKKTTVSKRLFVTK